MRYRDESYTWFPVNTNVTGSRDWLVAVVNWCYENIGPFMQDWGHRRDTFGRVDEFWFRYAEDAVAFKLKWMICTK